jgi:hypothetical protein
VDDNGEDDDGIRRHQATTNPVMATMATMAVVAVAAMVDDDDAETASLYVVGPDDDGGDYSWWGVQVVMWVHNDVVAFVGSSTLLLTYL